MLAQHEQPAKALRLLEQLEAMHPLSLRDQALKAWLVLRTGEPERSHDLFLKIREATKDREDPDGEYIRRYAQARLAHIRFDPFNSREQERKAEAIPCDRYLKRVLWLPSGEETHPLDEEFDAWMKKNAPKEGDLRKRRIF